MARRGRHLAPTIRRISRTWVLPLTLVMSLVMAGVAWADDVVNDIDLTLDPTLEVMPIAVGSTGSTLLRIVTTGDDGKPGCNLTGSTTLKIAAASTNSSVATATLVHPTASTAKDTFTSCGDTIKVNVSALAAGTTDITFSEVSNDTGATFNLNPAAFTVTVAPAPVLNTPPSVSVTGVSDGATYEFGSVPAAGCSVIDAEDTGESAVPQISAITGSLAAYGLGSQTVTCSYTDGGGLSDSDSATYTIRDTGDPVITDDGATAAPTGANSWYIVPVTNTFIATDSGAGFPSPLANPHNFAKSSGTAEGSAVKINSGTVADVAGNVATAIDSAAFKIDLSNPSIAITSPADGSTTIAAGIAVSGTVSDAISGVASVDVNGGAATLGTGTFSKSLVGLDCGANTIIATATDNAGLTNTSSITVNRTCFNGIQFYQPLDQTTPTSGAMINSGKYGRVIPVKVTFAVDGGGPVTQETLDANGWSVQIGVNGVACSGGAATDSIEAYADAGMANSGTSSFRWDATSQQWIYNLDTKAPPSLTMAINSCYRLDVYVFDGTTKVKVSTTTYAIFKPVK